MSSNKKETYNFESYDSTNSYDLLEYNNIYDELNKYYVNSYDDKAPTSTIDERGKLNIVSVDDEIHFIHNDNVSERHKQIHEEKQKKKKTTTSKSSSKKSTSTKTTNKNTTNKKTSTYTSSSSTNYSNPKYSESQYKSRPEVEAYSIKDKKKKNSGGCLWFIIMVFFIAPSLLSSCGEFLSDTAGDLFSNISSYVEDDEEEVILFEGEKSELITVYETNDTEHSFPYYYDKNGNVYNWDYELIDYWTVCEFPNETMVDIKTKHLTTKHSGDKGFITVFSDPITYKVYYVIDGSFYDMNDCLIAMGDINVPTNVLIEITNYQTQKLEEKNN